MLISIPFHTQTLLDNELNDDLSFSRRKAVISNEIKGGTSRGYRKEYLTDEAIKILEKARKLNPTVNTCLNQRESSCLPTALTGA